MRMCPFTLTHSHFAWPIYNVLKICDINIMASTVATCKANKALTYYCLFLTRPHGQGENDLLTQPSTIMIYQAGAW